LKRAWLQLRMALAAALLAACAAPAALGGAAPVGDEPRGAPVVTDRTLLSRFVEASTSDDYPAQAEALEGLAKRWPDTLRKLPMKLIQSTADNMRAQADSGLHARLLEALLRAGYVEELDQEPSWLWCELALVQWERGDHKSALATYRHIAGPYALVGLSVDKRYAGLVASLGHPIDVAAAMKAETARLERFADTHPYNLKPRVATAFLLARAGRYDEALRLLDRVIAQVNAATPGHDVFADQTTDYVWVLDAKATVLMHLSHPDEAVAAMNLALQLPEHGQPNVSQRINLAEIDNDLGHAKEALAVLSGIGRASAFGMMQTTMEHFRAALQLGDDTARDEALRYMTEHQKDAPRTYQRALILSNRLDDAETLLLKRLSDPVQRLRTLVELQDYAPQSETPIVADERARRKALLGRPIVQAAVEQVGKIGKFTING
jgi:tetratricopeptide (TPR) repeat protein